MLIWTLGKTPFKKFTMPSSLIDQQRDLADSDWLELLVQSKAGCPESFEKMAQEIYGYLTLVANRQLGSQLQAKLGASDIVQSGLMKAFGSIQSFRGSTEAEFRGWLQQIILNTLRKQSRRYQSQKRLIDREQGLDDLQLSRQATPDQFVISQEQQKLLRGFVSELSPAAQRVIEMRYRFGYSLPKIAQILNVNESKIRRISQTAVEELKAQFARHDKPDFSKVSGE